MLTCRRQAIMATGAGTQHLQVIHLCSRLPQGGGMTIFADVGRTYMIETPANGGDAVVTTDTAFGGRGVVKGRRCPCRACVAIVAGFRAGDMI